MVKTHREPAQMRFKGTVFDLETIGEFNDKYQSWETERYADHKPTIFGYITNGVLLQYCAEGYREIEKIIRIMNDTLPNLDEPFYVFNCHFERGVCTHSCTNVPVIMIDVRDNKYHGSKWDIREQLGIPTYDDPFDGSGYRCMIEWQNKNYDDCLKHNRACLLIERDIYEHAKGIRHPPP